MRRKSINRPVGGLDFDSEDRLIDPSDYRYALNASNTINNAERTGTLTNIRGTLPITTYNYPYNNNVTPTGENVAIGYVEDTQENTGIWFIWNSEGKHHILRHYRDRTNPSNPYGVANQIIQYDFGWTRDTRITSTNIVYGNVGDLLYWTDNVKPRSINMTKADVVGKQKSWRLNYPVTCNLQLITVFTFKDFSGATIYSVGIATTDQTSRETTIINVAEAINVNPDSPVTAEACDCKLYFKEKVAGTVWAIETDCPQILVSARLEGDGFWYGATLVERFFDLAKYQFLEPNIMSFGIDEDYEPNYVVNKVFQSRLQPLYDDGSGTDLALGVWSQIAINNLACDGTSDPQYNYIDINFNGQNIANEQTLVVLKSIRLVMRERNTGSDRSIIDLDPCDFLDYDYTNNEWLVHYKFYNDIISSAVDTALAAKLYDDVPIQCDSLTVAKNRLITAGIEEGRNAPDCIDASVQIDFADTANIRLRKITGKIRVLTYGLGDSEQKVYPDVPATSLNPQKVFYNTFPNYRKYPFWRLNTVEDYTLRRGGVFHDILRTENDFPFFGGGGFGFGAGGDFGITSGMEDRFDQRLPEAGWPVYAAGTDYFTVSKQITTGLPIDSNGALDTSTEDKRNNIGKYLYDGNDLYSTFELLVPDNATYVIRLASHWCSFGDKLEKGFAYNLSAGSTYQTTSTNVWSVIDSSGTEQRAKELTITVSGADVDCGTFIVADLAPPFDNVVGPNGFAGLQGIYWQPINGYVVSDPQGSTDINNTAFQGVTVEKALVTYGNNGTTTVVSFVGTAGTYVFSSQDTGWQNSCITDHNGYFFGIGGDSCLPGPAEPTAIDASYMNAFPISVYENSLGAPNNIKVVRDRDTIIYTGSVSDYYNKTLVPQNYNGVTLLSTAPALVHGFVTINDPNCRNEASSFVVGNVFDQNGNGVGGVNLVYQTGRTTTTQTDGSYELLVWCDMLTANAGLFSSQINTFVPISNTARTVDYLVAQGAAYCNITYPNGQLIGVFIIPFGTNGTTTPPPYSPTAKYEAQDLVIDEGNNPALKAHKRGGNYTYGIRLYDSAGRLCSVVKAFEVYVPFITEDIGKYGIQDFSGNIYPAGTYKYGKPQLKAILAATTTFDSWVAYMQWMRTKNTIQKPSYLQWVANQVTYLSAVATASTPEIQTAFQNADAVAIKISLSNITTYYAYNNNSQVGYNYTAGDRLRLIADRNLENYQGVYDFEITSYDTTTQSIIIKPEGFGQEILSGTLFEIFNPKSVATEDEQIFYEVGEVIPVTNGVPESYSTILTNGDTYWRGRTIIVNDEATKFAAAYPVVIESASISDFYVSEDQDIGRIGTIDPNFKQLYNPSKIRFSNQYSVETANNGLSAFETDNQKDLPREYGTIRRLIFTNNNLVCIMDNREISNYIGLVTLMQASKGAESGLVSVTDSFLGTEYVHRQMLGTDFAGSVTLSNEGVIYGYNNKSANAWKYASEESVISDVKMINYFTQLSVDGISDATAIFDRYREEYILCVKRRYSTQSEISFIQTGERDIKIVGVIVPDGFDLPSVGDTLEFQYQVDGEWLDISSTVLEVYPYSEGGYVIKVELETAVDLQTGAVANLIYYIPETIAWNELKKRWTTFYSFTPDCFGVLRTELYSHKNGLIWIHNKNPLYNNFYGVQYKSAVTIVPNNEPDTTKNWYALYIENEQIAGFNWSVPVISNNNKQASRILNNVFKRREEFYFAEFKRDLNTAGVTNAIINGRQLRSSSIQLAMENNYTGEFVLRNIVCEYDSSARQ